MAKEIRISLLGHKDHGKSTLIGRILHDTGSISADRVNEARAVCASMKKEFEFAFLLDSFVEEREGGFTLDTTVAQARRGDFIFDLVDVPGHKELVRNMLSGASLADAAILIVSAKEDEGLQDETRLHIYLARMLGIEKIVVAVNKMDTAGYGRERFEVLREEILGVLVSLGFDRARAEFVPVSARAGDNIMERSDAMPWYAGEPLIRHMEGFASGAGRLASLPPRMFVQDVYPVQGRTLVVGKIESGSFSEGEGIVVGPRMLKARIVEMLGSGGKRVRSASAGQNVGLTLSESGGVARGDLCTPEGRPVRPSRMIRARIFCLPEGALEPGERFTITCASQERGARILRVLSRFNPAIEREPVSVQGAGRVGPCEAAEAELEAEGEVLMEKFSEVPPTGRFIISKKGRIAAVGVVI